MLEQFIFLAKWAKVNRLIFQFREAPRMIEGVSKAQQPKGIAPLFCIVIRRNAAVPYCALQCFSDLFLENQFRELQSSVVLALLVMRGLAQFFR